jgi:ABC-2 type transport system ATP-binding protein
MTTIEARNLTKQFGDVLAVDDLSFALQPGTVTGFIGPNGAGKTTTLRMLLGLVTPTAGEALIDGRPYRHLQDPARHVGAVLEATGFQPGRTGRDHLRVLATAAGIPLARADEVLAEVDLAHAARRRVGGYSLGMRQRLGLAAALLGDPQVLILDEPANGLDPEGVHWLRQFMRGKADQGCTVLVSSHILAELALVVDEVLIVSHGRLVAQGTVADLAGETGPRVRVRTPHADRLRTVLAARGIDVDQSGDDVVAAGVTTEAVGRAVADAGLVVYEMRLERPDLEQRFLELTRREGR